MSLLLATKDEGDLPNPDSLDGWIGEENGMTQWPKLLLSDITLYLMQDHPGSVVDLQRRLLNEYKEGKAYRLYEGGWLKEIFYCPISLDSQYCFLKADCTHSMKIRDVPHKLWICCTKNGDIKSAYCTCTAGLGGSCVHITAMFFRVESAVRRGFAGEDVCTSKPCVWDVPSQKTVIEPMRLTDMKFTAAKFQKESTRSLTDHRRQLFSPVAERHVTSDDSNREKMKGLLELLGPESCLSSFFEKECTTRDKSSEHEPSSDILSSDSVSVPTTATRQNLLLTLAQQCDSVESYLSKMPFLTENEVKEIEQATIGQSKSSIWIEERKGRITASYFYQVYTRVNSVISLPKNEQKVDNTLKLLMGYNKDLSGLKSIEYGRKTEEIAKEVFSASFEKDHLNASVIDCGLFVHKEKPFLAATPDALLSCSCCGEGVFEIKCPVSAADKFPNPDTVNYLLLDEESVKLKKNHAYYPQVQGQIVISNRKYCVFFVYTSKGTFSQTIYFDEAFWNKIVYNLDYFFRNHMVEELLSGALKKKIETDKDPVKYVQ